MPLQSVQVQQRVARQARSMPTCICTSPNNQCLSLCASWNLSHPLHTHVPTICLRLFGAVAVPLCEQLHRAHPRRRAKCCLLSSREGGRVGRIWRLPLPCLLRALKKCLFCSDHNREMTWLVKCSSSLLDLLQNILLALSFLWSIVLLSVILAVVRTLCCC